MYLEKYRQFELNGNICQKRDFIRFMLKSWLKSLLLPKKRFLV